MRRFVKALAAGTLAAVMLTFCHFQAVCGEIQSEVVRLHVLAHDDTAAEQALKLEVRDAVLAAADGLLDGVGDSAHATDVLEDALPQLTAAANDALRAAGSPHTATVSLQETYFTTRTYESGTLPAGWYTALRVVIGEGAGQNWWCVVFPPLCLSSAVKPATLDDVVSDEARTVVEQPTRYTVRFKVVEWLSGWFGR